MMSKSSRVRWMWPHTSFMPSWNSAKSRPIHTISLSLPLSLSLSPYLSLSLSLTHSLTHSHTRTRTYTHTDTHAHAHTHTSTVVLVELAVDSVNLVLATDMYQYTLICTDIHRYMQKNSVNLVLHVALMLKFQFEHSIYAQISIWAFNFSIRPYAQIECQSRETTVLRLLLLMCSLQLKPESTPLAGRLQVALMLRLNVKRDLLEK